MAGIGIYVHATFLLLVLWIAFAYWQEEHRWGMALQGAVFTLALFLCILLHELGHALVAKRFGHETKGITLLPIGGVATLQEIPEDPKEELLVALAGPAVTAAVIVVFAALLALRPDLQTFNEARWTAISFPARLMIVNVFLLLFNLLPAFPMDGGRVVRALLAMKFGHVRATRVAAILGQTFAFIFGIVGLFTNPFLVLIAVFIWVGAAGEARMSSIKSIFDGIPVSRAMFTEFHALSPDDPVSLPVELIQRGPQQDFPVIENGNIVGIVAWNDLLSALTRHQTDRSIKDLMRKDFTTIKSSDSLQKVFIQLQESNLKTLPVTDGRGRLAGLLTSESVAEFIAVQTALAH